MKNGIKRITVVGAGFAGAVVARELALTGRYLCTVYDERNHVAGNCHTQRDSDTGVMVHEYGPHIFNTSREDVWDYMNQWSQFGPYVNRVKAVTKKGVFSLPHTRISEHKHFAPWEQHENSICFQEYSKLTEKGDVPYYPLRLSKDKQILSKYIQLAEQEKNVTFIGRLGTYRYLDMYQVIGESLDLSKKCLDTDLESERWPSFSVRPL